MVNVYIEEPYEIKSNKLFFSQSFGSVFFLYFQTDYTVFFGAVPGHLNPKISYANSVEAG